MLNSRLGLACYSLLQNRWVWAHLSQEERAAVLRGNVWGNTQRPDYADPSKYQGGEDFDAIAAPRRALEREQLVRFLDRLKPESILEIGPGSGHLTRTLEQFSVVPSTRAWYSSPWEATDASVLNGLADARLG